MRLDRFMAASLAALIIFWRLVVITMNDVWAISRNRWIDSSYWLAEDPLFGLERVIARVLLPATLDAHTTMYSLEIVGVLLWILIGAVVAGCLLRLRPSVRQPLAISWPLGVIVWLSALVCAYIGGLWRERIVASLLGTSAWSWLTTTSMMVTVIAIGYAPVLVLGTTVWWISRRNYDGDAH